MYHSVSIDKRNQDLGRPHFVSRQTFDTPEAAVEWAKDFFKVELVEVFGMTKKEIKEMRK